MSNRSTQPAIRGWQSQPPAGGWPFTYQAENGQRFPLKGFSAQQVVDNLNSVLKLNQWYISDAHTWAIANGIWCARDPERCLPNTVTVGQLPQPEAYKPVREARQAPHWETKPEHYGPQVWLALNLFGMVFDKEAWDKFIALIRKMLSPHLSPQTGCAKCMAEFEVQCRQHPPGDVHNEQQAAEWVFTVHNAINQKLGKMPLTWRAAAKRFAWRVSL